MSKNNKQVGGVYENATPPTYTPINNEVGDTELYQKCIIIAGSTNGCSNNSECKTKNKTKDKTKKYCNLVYENGRDGSDYNKSCQCTEHKNEKTFLESASEFARGFFSGQLNKGEGD